MSLLFRSRLNVFLYCLRILILLEINVTSAMELIYESLSNCILFLSSMEVILTINFLFITPTNVFRVILHSYVSKTVFLLALKLYILDIKFYVHITVFKLHISLYIIYVYILLYTHILLCIIYTNYILQLYITI